MSTLEEVRKSNRRYHTFVGKPRKVVSGKPMTKIKQSSQRFGVLMDDQIEMVQEIQEQLQQAMVHLLGADTVQDSHYWRSKVDDLRARSDELVLILKVVSKLNSELVHARMRLRGALRREDEVVATRKRVVWLEERIHQLLKKHYPNETVVGDSPEVSIAAVSPVQDAKRLPPAPIDRGDNVRGSGDHKMAGGDATGLLPAIYPGGITAAAQQECKVEPVEPSVFITEKPLNDMEESSKSPILANRDEIGDSVRGVVDGSSYTTDWPAETDGGYWDCPHHRFDFNEQFDAITSENPLSYHNLGLAVTSSFVEHAPRTDSELPWQRAENGDDIDSQQLAMEKISDRIQEIIGQMEEAALSSAEYESPAVEGRQSQLLNHIGSCGDHVPKVSDTVRQSSPPGNQRDRSNNADTDRDVTLPPVGSRSTNPNARSRKYYPKPVPSPEVLPVTRMNRDRKYPRISTDWNDTPRNKMEPTIRVVDGNNAIANTSPVARRKCKSRCASPPKEIRPSAWSSPSNRISPKTGSEGDQAGSLGLADLIGARCHSGVKNLDKEGPKWERVMKMLSSLKSERVEARRDTARNLGALDCCEPSVVTALTERLQVDADARVRYESAKSLISLGFWSPLPVTVLVGYLRRATHTARLDVVRTIISARNTHTVDQSLPAVQELISTLGGLCASTHTGNDLAFSCAVCLGRLGVPDLAAKQRLLHSLESKDTHVIAPSLELLVRLFHESGPDVVGAVLDQLQNSAVWKHRAVAAKLLGLLGPECFQNEDARGKVLLILRRQLYDDPVQRVRAEVASTLTSLGMRDWVAEQVQKELFSEDDRCRAHAVISVGVLGLRRDRTVSILLDMLEIDPCAYVRLQAVRTLAALGAAQPKIIRALRDRERAGGPLGREATKALRSLVAMSASRGSCPSSPRRRKMRSLSCSPAVRTSPLHRMEAGSA